MASSDVHNNSGHLEMPLAVKKFDPNISKITKRTPFTKEKRRLPEPDAEIDFMNKLKKSLIQRKMMINFTVMCLQTNCGDFGAQVNYVLNMKLTMSCLNTCF